MPLPSDRSLRIPCLLLFTNPLHTSCFTPIIRALERQLRDVAWTAAFEAPSVTPAAASVQAREARRSEQRRRAGSTVATRLFD